MCGVEGEGVKGRGGGGGCVVWRGGEGFALFPCCFCVHMCREALINFLVHSS